MPSSLGQKLRLKNRRYENVCIYSNIIYYISLKLISIIASCTKSENPDKNFKSLAPTVQQAVRTASRRKAFSPLAAEIALLLREKRK